MATLSEARRILITGGTGNVGQHAVRAVEKRGYAARVLSRREQPQDLPAGRQWVRGDLRTADLSAAVEGADAIIHLASEKSAVGGDLAGIRRLLDAAREACVRHVVVISIIGCDRIPLPFYENKVAIEAAVRSSGVAWTVVRVAQFHSFVERLILAAVTPPIPTPLVAELRFQAVDEREVAEHLVDIALGAPLGDGAEIAGPEVISAGEATAIWLAAHRRAAALVPVSVDTLFGAKTEAPPWARAVLEGYRDGSNLPQRERILGRVRFAEWVAERVPR